MLDRYAAFGVAVVQVFAGVGSCRLYGKNIGAGNFGYIACTRSVLPVAEKYITIERPEPLPVSGLGVATVSGACVMSGEGAAV